jgi:hypothetical protein
VLKLDIEGLLKMDRIESNSTDSFFYGILNSLLRLKVSCYENDDNGREAEILIISSIRQNLQLIEEIAPLAFFEIQITKSVFDLAYNKTLEPKYFFDLLEAFKFLKTYKRFRKG